MHRGENERVVFVGAAHGEILRGGGRLERECREERGAVGVASGDDLELIEIGQPRRRVVVGALENGVVQLPHQPDAFARAVLVLLLLHAAHAIEERRHGHEPRLGARGRSHGAEGHGLPVVQRQHFDGGARRGVTHAGKQAQNAVPAHFVARILQHAQEGEHVFDVRGFEEFESAPFFVGNASVGEFDFEVGTQEAGAEEHRHFAQRRALLVQLQHAVHHERCLRRFVAHGHQPRRLAAITLGPQTLRVALVAPRDDGVGGFENGRRRAVVLLERDDARTGKLVRKIEDIANGRAAERINALRVVTHHRDFAVRAQPAQNA